MKNAKAPQRPSDGPDEELIFDDEDDAGVVRLSDVEEEILTWTWRGYLPDGKLTILEGDPGLGKSVLWSDLVGRISCGDHMPNGQPLDVPSTCLVVSAEDDLGDTLKPRLRAAGADMTRVFTLGLQRDAFGDVIPFTIPDDIARLERAMKQTGAKFVVIDPVMAFISEGIQTHNDASARRALTPLTAVAQETRAAFLLLRHLNKDQSSKKALYRGGGSIAFGGVARSVLLLAEDPDDRGTLVLAQVKNNLASRNVSSLRLRVEPWEHDSAIPTVRWGGASSHSANDLLQDSDARFTAPARADAERFLWELLGDGPMAASEVAARAGEEGITTATLRRATRAMGLTKKRVRAEDGTTEAWEWGLP